MDALLDQATSVIQQLSQEPNDALHQLVKAVNLLEAVQPSTKRDRLLAQAYLQRVSLLTQLGRTTEATQAFMLGFSYARTSKDLVVRQLAETIKRDLYV